MKLNINYSLILFLLLSCGKKESSSNRSKQLPAQSLSTDQNIKDLESIEKLLGSPNPNFALANYLIKTLDLRDPKYQKLLISEIDPKDIETITSEIKKKEKEIKEYFLFHNNPYRNDSDLISKSLLNKNNPINYDFSKQLEFATLNHLKNKALNDIIATYDQRSKELSSKLSLFVASEIGRNNQELSRQIEGLVANSQARGAINKIMSSREFISKMDELFKHSDLNESEQYLVVSSEVVAYGIYELVKEEKSFKQIMSEAKKVIKDIDELKEKGKEFLVLTTSLKKHFKETKENFENLSTSLSQASNDLNEAVREANLIPDSKVIKKKRVFNFIYNDILLGKETNAEGVNTSILSKKQHVSENITKSLESFNNLNNNLSSILQTTQKMSQILGIKPSKEVEKIIAKAQMVSEVTQTVTNVVAGWASGGPLGVISALSVSPIPGFSQESAEQEMLQEISKKLDVVLSNQEEIIRNQIATMKMIKDLANMLNDFHQVEMMMLADLRESAQIQQESISLLISTDLITCNQILTEKLSRFSDISNEDNLNQAGSNNLNFNYLLKSFDKSFDGKNSVNIFLNSNLKSRFTDCETGLAQVFSGADILYNPIRNIFNSAELYKFQNKLYFPLMSLLKHKRENLNLNKIPLHIPMTSMLNIRIKENYLNTRDDYTDTNFQNYFEFETLISTKGLERSVTSLILLYPFLDIEKKNWGDNVSNVIETYLSNTSSQSSIGSLYLRNALKLTQSAIAQEAILAGEPFLETIRTKYGPQMFSQKNCEEETLKDAPKTSYPLLCSLRSNRLLLKNYVTYLLFQKMQNNKALFQEYSKAIQNKDELKISYLLGSGVSENSISFRGSTSNIQATIKVVTQKSHHEIILPSAEEIKEGTIIYSENMETLLNIQEAILNELVKVTPAYDDLNPTHLRNALLLRNNI